MVIINEINIAKQTITCEMDVMAVDIIASLLTKYSNAYGIPGKDFDKMHNLFSNLDDLLHGVQRPLHKKN